MKLFHTLPVLLYAASAFARPMSNGADDAADDIPYGAFPDPTEPFVPWPSGSENSPDVVFTAQGRAIVENHCKFPVYIWSVGSDIRPQVTVQPYGRFFETFRHDPKSGGIAIKITTVRDGLLSSAPEMIFAYNLSGNNRVWYDLSDVFGDPFKGHRVSLKPSEPEISWMDGKPSGGSGVRVRSASSDLVLTLC